MPRRERMETTFDFRDGRKQTVRIDTGEIVEDGPMTEDEQKLAQQVIGFPVQQEQ